MTSSAEPDSKPYSLRQVPAVSRAIAILRLLGRSDSPLGVQSIARTLGLVPSTCLHILRVMAAEQLVAVDPRTKQYSLSAGTVALARSALQRQTFAGQVQPTLDSLSQAHGVTAIGVQALGLDHMIVVALSRSTSVLRIHVDVGSRFPLLISATGRCVAAFGKLRQKDIEKRFRALRWDNPPSLQQWRRDVARTRSIGYAIDDGNYIAGVMILAAPIIMPDGVVHSLVIVGVAEHLRRLGVERLGTELRARADSLSRALAA